MGISTDTLIVTVATVAREENFASRRGAIDRFTHR